MFPIINLFGREIGTYAIMGILGLFACATVAYFALKKENVSIEDIIILILVIMAGLFVGGHLLCGITNYDSIIKILKNASALGFKNTVILIFEYFSGLVFYGGFLGGIAALKIYLHYSKPEYSKSVLDFYAFSVPLFHFFGRIGCFLGGCCYGIESDFGFIAHGNKLVPLINGVRRFPVALLEASLNLIIFIVILYLFKKGKFKEKLIYFYMVLYSVVRFFVEFLRGDEIRGIFFGLSTSQWISICLFITGVFALLRATRITRTRLKRRNFGTFL